MKILLVILSLISIASEPLFGDRHPELWLKAKGIAEANWQLVPGFTKQTMVTYQTKSEKILHSMDIIVSHRLNEDGTIVNEIVEAVIGGEESDNPENNRMITGILEKDMTPRKRGMFLSDNPNNPSVEATGELMEINGFACTSFRFTYEDSYSDSRKAVYSGTAWLDVSTGAPILLLFSMDKLPMMLRELSIEQYYHFEPETNTWYQEKIVSDARVSLLIRRLTNESTITYSDYWRYDND